MNALYRQNRDLGGMRSTGKPTPNTQASGTSELARIPPGSLGVFHGMAHNLRMRSIAFLNCVVALGTQVAHGQLTATLWWEVDVGNGWQSGDVTTSNSTVTVRRMARWDGDFNLTNFTWSLFDATVSGPNSNADNASNFFQQGFLSPPQARFFGATRFGDVLKIDVLGDTAAPGAGTRWISPYQEPNQSDPQHANPMELFRYTLAMDETTYGVRTISQVQGVLPNVPGSNTTDRSLLIFDSQSGLVLPLTTLLDARINYIPTPGATLMCISGLAVLLRRR